MVCVFYYCILSKLTHAVVRQANSTHGTSTSITLAYLNDSYSLFKTVLVSSRSRDGCVTDTKLDVEKKEKTMNANDFVIN